MPLSRKNFEICLIGNSHLGSVIQGFKLLNDSFTQGKNFTFFGAPHVMLLDTALKGNAIVPSKDELKQYFLQSSGYEAIDILNYDIFVIHGFLVITQHLYAWSKVRFYSNKAYQAAFEYQFKNEKSITYIPIKLIQFIKTVNPKATIFISPRPYESLQSIGLDNYPEDYSDKVYQEYEEYFENIGGIFFPQPAETLESRFVSKDIYSKNGLHLFGDATNDDIHKNSTYGKVYLENLMKLIESKLIENTEI